MTTQTYRKKLIEVDLPLDAINREAVREKTASARKGHPSTLHRWWARRPLVASRALAFASLVDDPCQPGGEFDRLEDQIMERRRLHDIIRRLVSVDDGASEDVVDEAQIEIAKSIAIGNGDPIPQDVIEALSYIDQHGPTVSDPFCGGGSIPLETQRLGIKTVASDLNPVAVLITKALIELPQLFLNHDPTNLNSKRIAATWQGNSGLADDIRFFGDKVRQKTHSLVGHLYPRCNLGNDNKETVSAWLWLRSLQCANPACGAQVPLTKSFQISSKRGNNIWIKPIYDSTNLVLGFQIQDNDDGVPKSGSVNRNGATCIACGTAVPIARVREYGRSRGFQDHMVAVVAGTGRNRHFMQPDQEQTQAFLAAKPKWKPAGQLPDKARSISTQLYGYTDWSHHFNQRQMAYLTNVCDVLNEIGSEFVGTNEHDKRRVSVIKTYLSLALGRTVDHCSSFNRWDNSIYRSVPVFARQGIGMIWDYSEINPFAFNAKDWSAQVEWVAQVVERLPRKNVSGTVMQSDASTGLADDRVVVITDPPYYDNIHYADSSDFFYVWHRAILKDDYPELFSSILAPKMDELVANKFRHEDASSHFEAQLTRALVNIRNRCDNKYPSSFIYGYKQQESSQNGYVSTGWEKMLIAIIDAGFTITGTWPIRSENPSRPNANKTNSLATSVAIVVRPRLENAPVVTRQEFFEELEMDLPIAIDRLTRSGHIAPADLPQAVIGPGMEIFSKYARIETISGEVIAVREALQQINRVIGAYFDKEEGELDAFTRFCIDWVKIHDFDAGKSGDADNIAQAKNILMSDVANIHNLSSYEGGVTQLHPISEYHPKRKYPMTSTITAWEGCMRMAYHLDTSNEDGEGVVGCGKVGRLMAGNLDSVERLARILYNHYDNLNQPRKAYIHNQLVSEWQNILDEVHGPEERQLL